MQEENWTLEGLFKDRPACLKLYYGVEQYIKSLGDVEIGVTKTQVSFGVRTKFAWVWLPQLWTKNRPEDSITLTFDLDHQMSDHRIVETVQPGPGRWTHHVIIEKEADLDKVVKAWLAQAYEFGKINRRKRRTTAD